MKRKGSDEALVAAAAEGRSYAQIAEVAGISVATVKRRLAEPDVVEAVRDFRLQQRRRHLTEVERASGDAIERLHSLVLHEDPHVALRAISLVLATGPKLTATVDLEERLRVIEQSPAVSSPDLDDDGGAA